MKFVIDSAIPFINGVLEQYGEVKYLNGSLISHSEAIDADALIIRTRTKCDAELLEGTSVKLIATATIGTDHIDLEYCKSHNIQVASAPGCNSSAVCQWVYAAVTTIAQTKNICLNGLTIGVIGVGHVGSKVAAMAELYGMNTLLNDPPREAVEGGSKFVSLDDLLTHSDIVTLHVPLSEDSRNMASTGFFNKMKQGSIFLNASRGEVVDEGVLLANISKFSGVALDVWRGEPLINKQLLRAVDIATMHIAGYSVQGKINGTNMTLAAVCGFFNLPKLSSTKGVGIQTDSIDGIIPEEYDIMADDAALRAHPEMFEELRVGYCYR